MKTIKTMDQLLESNDTQADIIKKANSYGFSFSADKKDKAAYICPCKALLIGWESAQYKLYKASAGHWKISVSFVTNAEISAGSARMGENNLRIENETSGKKDTGYAILYHIFE